MQRALLLLIFCLLLLLHVALALGLLDPAESRLELLLVIYALDVNLVDLPTEGERCHNVLLHDFIVLDSIASLLDDFDLSSGHASDLEENVELFGGRGHLGVVADDAVLLVAPNPARRQIEVLLHRLAVLLEFSRWTKDQWWAVKQLDGALLDDSSQLLIEPLSVDLIF